MSIGFHVALFLAGLFAASYSTLIGGGTLVTVPVMIYFGIPPQISVATNRVGVLGLSIAGWTAFHRQGLIHYKLAAVVALACGAGSLAGAHILVNIPADVLKKIIGGVGLALAAVALVQSDAGLVEVAKPRRGKIWLIGVPLAFALGMYGSIYGAGLGTALTYMLILMFGQTFLQSAGTRKLALCLQALVASVYFYFHGLIHLPAAANLLVSMSIGSYLGVHYGARLGNRVLKYLFLGLAAVMAAGLLI